ncbi:MAG TPA: peptidase M35, partial [Telluria sp.]|nr:peptidase M35 [Telluria sp.]
MNWNPFIRTGIATLALALCIGAQAASNGVVASISVDKHAYGKADAVVASVTITNTSASPQYVLKWHTPFGDIEESLFAVSRDGLPVPYLGARYKRPAPTAADYYLLKPGASYSAKVDLGALYDLRITGDYQIRYDSKSLSLFSLDLAGRGAAPREVGEITSAPVTVWIDGSLPRGAVAPETVTIEAMRAAAGSGSLAFNKCTAAQQGEVTTALGAGLSMVSDGDAYMSKGQPGPRY